MSTSRGIPGGLATAWPLIASINAANGAAGNNNGELGPAMAFPDGVLPESIDGFPTDGPAPNVAPGATPQSENVIISAQKHGVLAGWNQSFVNAMDVFEAYGKPNPLDEVQKVADAYAKATPTQVGGGGGFTEIDPVTGEVVPVGVNGEGI
jgi:hypothetical protein